MQLTVFPVGSAVAGIFLLLLPTLCALHRPHSTSWLVRDALRLTFRQHLRCISSVRALDHLRAELDRRDLHRYRQHLLPELKTKTVSENAENGSIEIRNLNEQENLPRPHTLQLQKQPKSSCSLSLSLFLCVVKSIYWSIDINRNGFTDCRIRCREGVYIATIFLERQAMQRWKWGLARAKKSHFDHFARDHSKVCIKSLFVRRTSKKPRLWH